MGTLGSRKEIEKLAQQLREQPKQEVGKLPNKGDIIEVNGLKYEVTFVDKALRRFHAHIINSKDEKKEN